MKCEASFFRMYCFIPLKLLMGKLYIPTASKESIDFPVIVTSFLNFVVSFLCKHTCSLSTVLFYLYCIQTTFFWLVQFLSVFFFSLVNFLIFHFVQRSTNSLSCTEHIMMWTWCEAMSGERVSKKVKKYQPNKTRWQLQNRDRRDHISFMTVCYVYTTMRIELDWCLHRCMNMNTFFSNFPKANIGSIMVSYTVSHTKERKGKVKACRLKNDDRR